MPRDKRPELSGEDALISRLLTRLPLDSQALLLGPGSDCAVADLSGAKTVLSIDQLVEGVHFTPDTPPALVGRKLLARNLSDLAAAGARPCLALLACAPRPDLGTDYLLDFHQGLGDCARQHGVAIAGGDISRGAPGASVFSLTIIGQAASPRDRLHARPGQLILATGSFGLSFESGHHLHFSPRLREGQLLAAAGVSAMMDVSDGLLLDLGRMMRSSGCRACVDESALKPRCLQGRSASLAQMLGDGEDYELLACIDEALWPSLAASWPADAAALTIIGRTVPEDGLSPLLCDSLGQDLRLRAERSGHDHFPAPPDTPDSL